MTTHRRLFCLFGILMPVAGLAGEEKADQKTVRAVIENAIQAHGGAERLAKLNAVRWKIDGVAELSGGSIRFSAELTNRLPDRHRVAFTVAGDTEASLRVVNGKKAWKRVDGRTEELAGDELSDALASVYHGYVRSLNPLIKNAEFGLSLVGEAKVDDRSAVGIRVEAKGRPGINLFFDKENGLLLKAERRSLGPNRQEATLETYYRDYKSFEGVMQPTTLVLHYDGKFHMRQEVTELRFLDEIEDSHFQKP